MTQLATQITLSVAGRVREWSRQERDLAIALRGLHVPGDSPSVPASMFSAIHAPSVLGLSPSVVERPVPRFVSEPDHESISWIGGPATGTIANAVASPEMAPPASIQTVPTGAPVDTSDQGAASGDTDSASPTMATTSELPTVPPGPFDGFIAAVANPTPAGPRQLLPLPPPSRFMVRVAPVGQPHRPTKRNYDYFEELNANLAARAAARQQPGRNDR